MVIFLLMAFPLKKKTIDKLKWEKYRQIHLELPKSKGQNELYQKHGDIGCLVFPYGFYSNFNHISHSYELEYSYI